MRCTRALRLTSRLSARPFVPCPSFTASPPHHITSPRAATLLPTSQTLQRPGLRCFSASPLARQKDPPPNQPWTPFNGPPDNSREKHWKTAQGVKRDEPHYQMTFTCKPCRHRSAHRVSKHGYHSGTVLIQCPNCKVRHLISDHMMIFRDGPTDLEGILEEKGELIKRGTLNAAGDLELWEDGSETPHAEDGSQAPYAEDGSQTPHAEK